MQYILHYLALLLNGVILITSESYYTISAPGTVKSNRNYTVAVSLHEADEPATFNIRIEGPLYSHAHQVYLRPYQTKSVVFHMPKLAEGEHKLIAEGISGIIFRNESKINVLPNAGPKIYIQSDKAVYKPGDEVQFRVLILDEHTRPLKIDEPIRVEILDGKQNLVKQFKDIQLVMGIYKGKLQLSKYPVMGSWKINVVISGKYDYAASKEIHIKKYILPKFSVHIEGDDNYIIGDSVFKVVVYGKYTFDKYVEGNLTARIVHRFNDEILLEKLMVISGKEQLEFAIGSIENIDEMVSVLLYVDLTEKHTGRTHTADMLIYIRKQRFMISVDYRSIQYKLYRPYAMEAHVSHWNGSAVFEHNTPLIMQHGSKEYAMHLNDKGDAIVEFNHESGANHVFRFNDSMYTIPNIYTHENLIMNMTNSYCWLTLKGGRPRLGTNLEIEVNSVDVIPYINYIIVSHANILHAELVHLPPNRKSHTIVIKPSIEMIPTSFIYVHFVQNGHLRYDELELKFPFEFENQISVTAPKQVNPGQEIVIDLKAQPKSYVGVLAVDLGVYLLDPSYDLKRKAILQELDTDRTYTPMNAMVYPGSLTGLIMLTNAHYKFLPVIPNIAGGLDSPTDWNFRQNFPETWMFENYEIMNETTTLKLTVPDSITTWRLTAFTVNEITGFGIVDGPCDITARQTFFLVLNLPYSVKRGEIVAIPILVHNYHNQSLDTEIVLHNSDQDFNYVESKRSQTRRGSTDLERMKRINVPANGVTKVEFLIYSKLVGEINLRVTAKNRLDSDAVLRKLKVEPEGVIKRDNKAVYVQIPRGGTYTTKLTAEIPGDIVPDSEYLTLSVGGDSLVPALENLNSLVLLPTGCGEQNMVNFAPNVLVLDYLKAVGKYFKERNLVAKAKNFIEIGFQQQLTYRHDSGGYSVFGQKYDDQPSTWLTAYVVRFFIKASKYSPIDRDIIESGLEFLKRQQLPNGEFPYTGYLFYPAQQNRYGFTSFVMMTFLEEQKYATKYQDTIAKALNFLNANLHKVKDTYALAILAGAFQRAKHPNAQIVMAKLRGLKRQSTERIWWSQNDQNREKDVEITAYSLMALLDGTGNDNDQPTTDLSIYKWLLDQRNERGGFKSTHDTVVGLQALVKFSSVYGNLKNINLKVQYSAKNNISEEVERKELTVDGTNGLVLQTEELPQSTRTLDIHVNGSGHSLIQFSYHYNVISDTDQATHFHIETKPQRLNSDEILLEICFSVDDPMESTDGNSTNMIIMETNLPSGYTTPDEFRNELLENEQTIQRIESENSKTTLVVYFRKLEANVEICVNILAEKVHDVLSHKPSSIAVYDYYNISRHNIVFYNV